MRNKNSRATIIDNYIEGLFFETERNSAIEKRKGGTVAKERAVYTTQHNANGVKAIFPRPRKPLKNKET